MEKTIVKTANAPSAIGPYSQGVITGGKLVFTAGQVAIDPASGKVIEGDVRAQTKQAMKNVEAILTEAGASLASVVKTTVFLKDMNDFAAMNEVYGEFFKENPPSRSTVEVARLPKDVRVEIEAIASL
jgi:2-iminobutanoate/2-iminopropanoate deaminase